MVMRLQGRMPRIGTRKLFFLISNDLKALNIKMGRDVLFNFLRAEHLLIKPKRSYVKTTNSKHWMKKYPNQIEQMTIERPEQVWVSDITYIKINEAYHYLSLVTDAYSPGSTTDKSLSIIQIVVFNIARENMLTGWSVITLKSA
jgi:putative transposase